MSTSIEIPNFDWTAFYYPELLDALLVWKRQDVPELTDESPQEPLIQLLRAIAIVGHLNNTLTDLVANESTLPTARLVETVRNMLRLIDYEMASATPAQADVIFKLAQVLSATVVVIPDFAQVASRASATEPARTFEVLDAYSVTRTDRLTRAFGVENNGGGPIYTDYTTEANDAGNPFSPWASPLGGSSLREGDSLLFGHSEAMFSTLDVDLASPAAGLNGVWEYYSGNPAKAQPDSVVDNGTTLTLDLTDYLGTVDMAGTPIRVQLNASGAYEDRFSYFVSGTNKVDTGSLLGQSTPSTLVSDYTIGSVWERFSDLIDNTFVPPSGTQVLAQDGIVTFSLPQTITENWNAGAINGVTAYWMRFRVTSVSAPVVPSINRLRIDTGAQYIKQSAIQGIFQNETLGSSSGDPKQAFVGSKTDFIARSDALTVDGVSWTRVDNFLASKPTDRHYRVQLIENNRAKFVFGDGVAGAIPNVGVNNIAVSYRWSAADDGNVGAATIVVDRSGVSLVDSLFNPRPAVGWAAAEGSTDASLAQAKIAGPASLRVKDVALGPDDAEVLVKRSRELDASLIAVTRAKAIEEGFGPKTLQLGIVPAGGGLATQDQLDAISEFFNGNQFVSPPKRKRMVANQQVTASNYIAKTINVTAVVHHRGNLTSVQVVNVLTRLLHPEAVKADGATYEWDFGGVVTTSRLNSEIFKVDSSIYDVDISIPAADVVLQGLELPVAGSINITVIAA